MSRVIVVGSVNEDLLVHAPIPAPGETVLARGDFVRLPGGKGANAACAAARLGVPTWFVGAVGADDAGLRALAQLRKAGVAVDLVAQRPEAATGNAIVVVDEHGENAIVVAAGANALVDGETAAAGVAELVGAAGAAGAAGGAGGAGAAGGAVASAEPGSAARTVVLTNLEIPLAGASGAAGAAAAHGLRFVLDPAPAQPLPPELIPPGAVIVPNEHELEQLGASPEELLAAGAAAVVVTRGAGGAEIHARRGRTGEFSTAYGGNSPVLPNRPLHIAAPRVEAVDTTGAGDAFRGALAAALAQGASLSDAVRFAVAAGALATTAFGARGVLPDRAAVGALMGA